MHAYLIMAHNEFEVLKVLLEMIDDERNDIYLHIDKKAKNVDFESLLSIPRKSKIYLLPRINIHWGAYNLIQAEMALFKAAFAHSNKYDFYHLLSGVDLPIKSQNDIHTFFSKHVGEEFISIHTPEDLKSLGNREYRFKYYHLLTHIGMNKRGISRINNVIVKMQDYIGIDRYKNAYPYATGSNWVSLSPNGVSLLVNNEKWISDHYKYSICCDEIYKQTLFIQNPELKLYSKENANQRLIIWNDSGHVPHPHTFNINDFDTLINSKCMFARKFSSTEDLNIIRKLKEHILVN